MWGSGLVHKIRVNAIYVSTLCNKAPQQAMSFTSMAQHCTFLQLLLNLPCIGLESAKWYNKERVSLHHAVICFNQSVIIIELWPLFRHGAIALNELRSVIIITPNAPDHVRKTMTLRKRLNNVQNKYSYISQFWFWGLNS